MLKSFTRWFLTILIVSEISTLHFLQNFLAILENDLQSQKRLASEPRFHPSSDVNPSEDRDSRLPRVWIPATSSFCREWSVNYDEWWTHHPDWEASGENQTHYCFALIKSHAKANYLRNLYHNQFHGDCNHVFTGKMWSSGWGADLSNIIMTIQHAKLKGVPAQMKALHPWQWAKAKPTRKNPNPEAVCPTQDMNCYFLPLSNCAPSANITNYEKKVWFFGYDHEYPGVQDFLLDAAFATRPQTWLRKRVFDMVAQQNITTPCSVLHVRRGDVVLHLTQTRKYRPIEDYVQHATNNNILLLTDDQNAIEEAIFKFPNLNWMYIDRPRYAGSEGGWEQHIPSGDPAFEMTVLQAIFQLASKCNQIVRTHSGLSGYIYAMMRQANATVDFVDLDGQSSYLDVFSPSNRNSSTISRPYRSAVKQSI